VFAGQEKAPALEKPADASWMVEATATMVERVDLILRFVLVAIDKCLSTKVGFGEYIVDCDDANRLNERASVLAIRTVTTDLFERKLKNEMLRAKKRMTLTLKRMGF
jgi:hypothetical protein